MAAYPPIEQLRNRTLGRILQKMGIPNQAELVRYALKHNLIDEVSN